MGKPVRQRSPGFGLDVDFAEGLPDSANELITSGEGRLELMEGAAKRAKATTAKVRARRPPTVS